MLIVFVRSFIFTLQEFAKELVSFVDAASRVYHFETLAQAQGKGWRRVFAGLKSCFTRDEYEEDLFKRRQRWEKKENNTLTRRLCTFSLYFSPSQLLTCCFHVSAKLFNGRARQKAAFPKIQPHAPNTILTPAWDGLTWKGKVQHGLWALGARLKSRTVKFSIKAGMATAVLASPAFFDATRPTFTSFRGEWALISVE